MQCPICTYSSLSNDHDSLLADVVNRFTTINDPYCQLLKPEDETEVSMRNCPDAPLGYVNRCWAVKGKVSATIAGKMIRTLEFNSDYKDNLYLNNNNLYYPQNWNHQNNI